MRLRLTLSLIAVLSAESFVPAKRYENAPLPSCHRRTSGSDPTSSSVVLGMGLRDFLRRKRKTSGAFNIPEDEPSQFAAPTTTPAPIDFSAFDEEEVVEQAESYEQETGRMTSSRNPMRMGEDPSTKQLNLRSLESGESVQEKINRVKAGKMTQTEKQAYLDSVLSTGNSSESRKPLIKPKYEDGRRAKQKASPFPSDSLLRNVARGKKSDSFLTSDILEKAQSDSQRKKQDYLNMVTDPNRFNSLSTGGGKDSGVTPQPGSAAAGRKTPIASTSDLKPSKSKLLNKYFPTQLPEKDPMPSDLGARLGRQAMEHERARQQAEEERRDREWQEKEKVRLGREKLIEHQTQIRQETLEKQEAEVREQRRTSEETKQREELEKREAEEKRLEALMKAQEDYWKKKLDRNRGLNLEDDENKEGDNEGGESTKAEATDGDTKEPSPGTATEPKPVERSAGTSSLNDVGVQKADDREFLEDQAKRKSKMERAKDAQLEKLKALNSPLPPAPARFNEPSTSPTGLNFEPQFGVNGRSSSSSSRGSLGNLVQGQSTAYEPLGLAPNKPKPEDIVADVSEDVPAEKVVEVKQSKPKAPPGQGGMMGFFGRNDPPKAKKKPRTPPPKPKGPIRMALPLEDIETDDEEDGVDVRSNKAMSIAEAMKKTSSGSAEQSERSKKWGIDMNKF